MTKLMAWIDEYRQAVPGYEPTNVHMALGTYDSPAQARERIAYEARACRQSPGMRVLVQTPTMLTIRIEVPLKVEPSGKWTEIGYQTICWRVVPFLTAGPAPETGEG